jgi:hypothetical protein
VGEAIALSPKGLRLAIEHFTLQDIVGCTLALPAFLPFLLAPGYLTGWTFNLFGFRDSSWRERLLFSLTLSVAITPILAALVGRYSSLSVVCWIFVAMTLIVGLLAIRALKDERRRGQLRFSRTTKIGLAMGCGWAVVAIASLVDVQIGHRLYIPAATFDQSLRSALAAAALRTGVPPANPFFYPGHPVALRYYYYWNVLCALPAKLFGLSPRVTTLAGVAWSGLALASLIPLYLKYFCEETAELGRKSLIGIALLAVTGLDLIPTLVIFVSRRIILADMEWWDISQVTSWIDSLLWVPHHVAGLVACLGGFLVLWVVPRNAPVSERLKAAVIAALAFASAAGLSVYVTFAFAIFLVIWTLVLLRSKLTAEALMFIAAGVVTLIVSLGYLHDLQQPGWNGSFATFYVRSLESVEDWAESVIPWNWLHSIFLVVLLPLYYLIELGFFALVGFVQARSYWRRSGPLLKWEWAAISICAVSLLVSTFMMSNSGNNDLGYRSILFAQFILVLWAVPLVLSRKTSGGKSRLLFYVFLWIGILGSAYQLVELRTVTMLADDGRYTDEISWLPHSEAIGEDLYRTRAGFETLNAKLPQNAIIQYGPANPAYVSNIYYSRRQSVAGLEVCGTAFGGDPFQCMPLQTKILEAFNGRSTFSLKDADHLCETLGIDVLIAERPDRMWSLRKSWVWSGRPLVENEYMRAIACGPRRAEMESKFGIDSESQP